MVILNAFWDIINTNFISSLLGGFLSAFVFWIVLEKRIKSLLEFRANRKISKSFLEELLYNRIIAEKYLEKEYIYKGGRVFNTLKYETASISEFLAKEPLNVNPRLYMQIRTLNTAAFKKDNMLLDIYWFTPDLELQGENRKMLANALINNAKNNIENIDRIVNNKEFQLEMREFGLTDDSQSSYIYKLKFKNTKATN